MRKWIKKLLILGFSCLISVCAVACIAVEGSSASPSDVESASGQSSTSVQKTRFSVTVAECLNGSVTVDKAQAKKGEKITLTLTADEGYCVSRVAITYEGALRYIDVNEDTAIFKMPTADVCVLAEFVMSEQDAREVVDYLVVGDSYTEMSGWTDFDSDMRDLPSAKTVGVGGTTVPQWGKTGTIFGNTAKPTGGLDNEVTRYDGTIIKTNILGKYLVNNFVFHLGVNDLRGGVPAETVISDLKILFEQYRFYYPNAHMYWVSLSLNVSDPQYTDSYKVVNQAIEEYAQGCEYLTYINTVDTMFPDGEPNADWFVDGLHFNQDGYATWSALIAEALGYPRADVDAFGNADMYYSSNTWNYDFATRTVNNEVRGTYSEQSLWFDGVYAMDMYAEMEVCVRQAVNVENDAWPKFGMAVKGNGNHAFFFIEATKNLTGKTVNYTERRPYPNRYVVCESSTWDWGIQGEWVNVPSLVYTDNTYVKLGLLRCGADMYFFVNGDLVFSKGGFVGCDKEMAIGLTLMNLNVSVRNYSVTTEVDDILHQMNIQSAPDAHFEGVNRPTFISTAQSGEVVKKLSNFSDDQFYFETEITLPSSVGARNGIYLEADGNGLAFFIDEDKKLSVLERASGGAWNEQTKVELDLPVLEEVISSTVKLALYKDGACLVLMVNGTVVLEGVQYAAFEGKASVGVIGADCPFTASHCKIASSDTILGIINQTLNFDD